MPPRAPPARLAALRGPGRGRGVLRGRGSTAWSRAARAGTSALTAGTGAISGRVTGKGKPLQGICVFAYPRHGGRGARVRTSTTGRYRLGSLKPAKYIVGFYDCTHKTNWLGQYYPGVPFFFPRPPPPTPGPRTPGKATPRLDAPLP